MHFLICLLVSGLLYHKPDEKPPGGTRFFMITSLAPFNAGTVVFISAATLRWMYPSPVIGFPSRFGQKIQIKLVRKKKIKKSLVFFYKY